MRSFSKSITVAPRAFFSHYAEAGTGQAGTEGTGTATGAAGGTGTAPPPPNPNPTPKLEETPEFQRRLQSEINRVNAEEKRKNQDLANQLRQLQQNNQLSQQEKEDLQHQITRLEESFQTKEQQAATALDKLKKDSEGKIKGLETERDGYKSDFERLLISVDIARAATEFEAHRVEQIEAILYPITKVVEAIDPTTGKPSGRKVAEVSFTGRDKDGKDVPLKITVKEAVKLMSEMTDKYGNLFKNKSIDGLNGNTNGQSSGGGALPDISKMSVEEYRKHREKIQAELRKH